MTDNTQSISFEIQKELPIKSWREYPSNAFARFPCPEMLTESGLQVVDVIGSRHSLIPANQRQKAVYTFDRAFVVATIQRLYQRLECDELLFAELVCDALELPDDSSLRSAMCDDAAIIPFTESKSDRAQMALDALCDFIREYRAMIPKPSDKGEYGERWKKAVQFVEKLESFLAFDLQRDFVPNISQEEVQKRLNRL